MMWYVEFGRLILQNSPNPTFQVARPITCPNGEMAGVTTGSKVIGSISFGRGFVSSTVGFPSSPHRFLYLSVRLTADHLYNSNSNSHTQILKFRPNQQPTTAQRTDSLLCSTPDPTPCCGATSLPAFQPICYCPQMHGNATDAS